MKELESDIEDAVIRAAKKLGYTSRKMNGLGFRDWPDRLFINTGIQVWIEFKRKGKEPTENQLAMHKWLRAMGQTVEVFDDRKAAIKHLTDAVETLGIHASSAEVHVKPRRGRSVPRTGLKKNEHKSSRNQLAAGKKLESWRTRNRAA